MPSLLQDVWNGFLDKLAGYTPTLITTTIILVIGYIIIRILVHIIEKFFDKVNFERSAETFIENIAKVALWGILIIVVLGNLGRDSRFVAPTNGEQ